MNFVDMNDVSFLFSQLESSTARKLEMRRDTYSGGRCLHNVPSDS